MTRRFGLDPKVPKMNLRLNQKTKPQNTVRAVQSLRREAAAAKMSATTGKAQISQLLNHKVPEALRE